MEDMDSYVESIVRVFMKNKDSNFVKNENPSKSTKIIKRGDDDGNESIQSVESICHKDEGNK